MICGGVCFVNGCVVAECNSLPIVRSLSFRVISVFDVDLGVWEGCGIASSLLLVSCFVSGGRGPTLTCVGVCFTFVCGVGECISFVVVRMVSCWVVPAWDMGLQYWVEYCSASSLPLIHSFVR